MRLPRGKVLRSWSLFRRVREEGRSFRGRHLVLGVLEAPEVARTIKVGIITTKRLGNAVVRNRVRRRLRGILQRRGEGLKPGQCLVLVARGPAATADSAALEKEWNWLARKAGLYAE